LLHCPNPAKNATGSRRRVSPSLGHGAHSRGETRDGRKGRKAMKKYARKMLYDDRKRRRISKMDRELRKRLEAQGVEDARRSRDPSWPGLHMNVVPLVDGDESDAGEIFEE